MRRHTSWKQNQPSRILRAAGIGVGGEAGVLLLLTALFAWLFFHQKLDLKLLAIVRYAVIAIACFLGCMLTQLLSGKNSVRNAIWTAGLNWLILLAGNILVGFRMNYAVVTFGICVAAFLFSGLLRGSTRKRRSY